MDCERFRELLPDLPDLDERTREELEAHAAQCGPCAEALAVWRQAQEDLRGLREEPVPEAFTRKWKQAMEAERRTAARRRLTRAAAGIAAALTLTAGLTAVLRQPGVLRAAAPKSAAVQGAPENGPADAGTLMQNSVYTAGEEAAYGEAAYGDTAYEEAEAVYDEAAYGAAEKNAVPASGTVPESAAEEGPAAPAAVAADVPQAQEAPREVPVPAPGRSGEGTVVKAALAAAGTCVLAAGAIVGLRTRKRKEK